jgi:hypothetical protein
MPKGSKKADRSGRELSKKAASVQFPEAHHMRRHCTAWKEAYNSFR